MNILFLLAILIAPALGSQNNVLDDLSEFVVTQIRLGNVEQFGDSPTRVRVRNLLSPEPALKSALRFRFVVSNKTNPRRQFRLDYLEPTSIQPLPLPLSGYLPTDWKLPDLTLPAPLVLQMRPRLSSVPLLDHKPHSQMDVSFKLPHLVDLGFPKLLKELSVEVDPSCDEVIVRNADMIRFVGQKPLPVKISEGQLATQVELEAAPRFEVKGTDIQILSSYGQRLKLKSKTGDSSSSQTLQLFATPRSFDTKSPTKKARLQVYHHLGDRLLKALQKLQIAQSSEGTLSAELLLHDAEVHRVYFVSFSLLLEMDFRSASNSTMSPWRATVEVGTQTATQPTFHLLSLDKLPETNTVSFSPQVINNGTFAYRFDDLMNLVGSTLVPVLEE